MAVVQVVLEGVELKDASVALPEDAIEISLYTLTVSLPGRWHGHGVIARGNGKGVIGSQRYHVSRRLWSSEVLLRRHSGLTTCPAS